MNRPRDLPLLLPPPRRRESRLDRARLAGCMQASSMQSHRRTVDSWLRRDAQPHHSHTVASRLISAVDLFIVLHFAAAPRSERTRKETRSMRWKPLSVGVRRCWGRCHTLATVVKLNALGEMGER